MNPARIARLLRELADEFDSPDDSASAPATGAAPKRRRRRPRAIVRPAGEASEPIKKQAAQILKSRGFG